jgi:hypothetical protein
MATGYQGYQGYQGAAGYGDPQRTQLDRKRQIAELLQQGATDTSAKSLPEGIAQLGKAFIASQAQGRADQAESAYADTVKSRNASLAAALMPNAQGIANEQLGSAAPFDLTPKGADQRTQQAGENSRYRPLVEALLSEGNLGGAVGLMSDQQQLAAQRAEAQRKANEPMTINNQLVDPNSMAVLGDFRDPAKPATPTYKETTLSDGIYYVNEADPADKVRLGAAPAKQGTGSPTNPAGLTEDQMKMEISLADKWDRVAAEWQDVTNMSDRAKTMGARGDAVGDLQLTIALTKLADPGTAAREGEVTLTQQTASLAAQAQNWIEKLQKGNTLLPPETRKAMLEAVNEMEGVYTKFYSGVGERAKQRVVGYGLDPTRVFLTMQPQSMRPPEPPKPSMAQQGIDAIGGALKDFGGMFTQPGRAQPQMQPQAKPPAGVDPLEWQHMTPEEKALFQ